MVCILERIRDHYSVLAKMSTNKKQKTACKINNRYSIVNKNLLNETFKLFSKNINCTLTKISRIKLAISQRIQAIEVRVFSSDCFKDYC